VLCYCFASLSLRIALQYFTTIQATHLQLGCCFYSLLATVCVPACCQRCSVRDRSATGSHRNALLVQARHDSPAFDHCCRDDIIFLLYLASLLFTLRQKRLGSARERCCICCVLLLLLRFIRNITPPSVERHTCICANSAVAIRACL